jgi:hypothetical protein
MPRRITSESSLETLRQEAKDWLRRLRANDADARARLDRAIPDAPSEPSLREVQFALARELGFAGWTALKRHKAPARSSESPGEALARYEQMAVNLLDAYRTGTPEAMERHWGDTCHRRAWPAMRRYVQLDLGKRPESREGESAMSSDASIDITRDDARWLVARGHGFESWRALSEHAHELIEIEGKTAPRGIRLLASSSIDGDGDTDRATRLWDEVFDALEDEEAVGLDAHGQMNDALLERIARYEHVTALHLNGSAALTDAGLKALARLPRLRVLDLSGCAGLTDEGFAVLSALPSLERVNLSNTRITDACVSSLARCERLERVDLAWTRTGDGTLRALAGKEQLSHLQTGSLVTDDGVRALHDFPVFADWRGGAIELELTSPDAQPNVLHLHGTITDAGLAGLVGLDGLFGLNIGDERLQITPAGLAPLKRLPHLGMLGVDAVDESMRHIADFPALRFLMCQDTTAGDEGWVALGRSKTLEQIWGRRSHNLGGRGFEALSKLPALRALSVSCLNVPDVSVARLPDFPALRELMPMDIPDEGYRHIARCRQLERLVLMYCRDTTDRATEYVAHLPRLRRYFASYTRITDRTPESLATMPALETIGLSGCAGVTNAGIAALRNAPRLRELRLGGMQHVTRDAAAGFPPSIRVIFTL